MYTRILTFALDGPSHDDFVEHSALIAESVAAWDGLVSVTVLADSDANRYGGVYVFESKAAADASRDAAEFQSVLRLPTYKDVDVEEFEILDLAAA